jgi:hypothetical protein
MPIVIIAIFVVLMTAGCATTQAPQAQYPAWLDMKPGYAETCAKAPGGCVPMTQAELQEMVDEVVQRVLQMCRRSST